MTVGELIKELEKFDPDYLVTIPVYNGAWWTDNVDIGPLMLRRDSCGDLQPDLSGNIKGVSIE